MRHIFVPPEKYESASVYGPTLQTKKFGSVLGGSPSLSELRDLKTSKTTRNSLIHSFVHLFSLYRHVGYIGGYSEALPTQAQPK